MQKEKQSEPAMSPKQFATEYTEYYQTQDSDSPETVRSHMIEQLCEAIWQKLHSQEFVTILDVGSGKQKLEAELQKHPGFSEILPWIKIVTMDIAHFSSRADLLASDISHVEANGAEMPFAENSFDFVFSCMAIDFMPRIDTFNEVRRVLKSDGDLFINFHHPNLQRNALLKLESVESARRSVNQKLRFARGSSKYPKYEAQMKEIEIEARDVEFVINIFPKLIFHCPNEIYNFLVTIFPNADISVEEFAENGGLNGWFSASILQSMESEEFTELAS